MSSRAIKTITRSSLNRQQNSSFQKIITYSCQIFLEQFKIFYRGYVYFMLSDASSQISSLKYQATGKVVQTKENLIMNIKIRFKNGQQLPNKISLKLMSEKGQELDCTEICTQQLTTQFKQFQIPMNRGLVNLKIRNKPMNIVDKEDINYVGSHFRQKIRRNQSKIVQNELDLLQQALNKSKKQLQDQIYINNKLKNDREFLLGIKQQLQLQIQTILSQIPHQIQRIKSYYTKKIHIRQQVFEQQIENVINILNYSSQYNKKLMQHALKQQLRAEQEEKKGNQKIKMIEIQINNQKNKYKQLLNEKQLLQQKLYEEQNTIYHKNKIIQQLNQHLSDNSSQINRLNQYILKLRQEIDQQKQINSRNGLQMAVFQHKIKALMKEIDGKNHLLADVQNKAMFLKESTIVFQKQKLQDEQKYKKILFQNEKLMKQLQLQQIKFQEINEEMQFNENLIKQFKKHMSMKQSQFQMQTQNISNLYQQQMNNLRALLLSNKLERQQAVRYKDEQIQQLKKICQDLRVKQDNYLTKQDNYMAIITNKNKDMQDINKINTELIKKQQQMNNIIDTLRKQNKQQLKNILQLKQNTIKYEAIIQQLKKNKQLQKNQLQAMIQKLKQQFQLFNKNQGNNNINDRQIQLNKIIEQKTKQHDDRIKKLNQQLQKINIFNKQLSQDILSKIEELKMKNRIIQQKDEKIKQINQLKAKNKNQILEEKHKNTHQQQIKNKIIQKQQPVYIVTFDGQKHQYQTALIQKQQQITSLKNRIQKLQGQYKTLSTKFDEISNKYNEIVNIHHNNNNQINDKIIEQQWCESQIQEQKQIQKINKINSERQNLGNNLEKKPSNSKFNQKQQIIRSYQQVKVPKTDKFMFQSQNFNQNGLQSKISINQLISKNNIDKLSRQFSMNSSISYKQVSHTAKIGALQRQIQNLLQNQINLKHEISNHLLTIKKLQLNDHNNNQHQKSIFPSFNIQEQYQQNHKMKQLQEQIKKIQKQKIINNQQINKLKDRIRQLQLTIKQSQKQVQRIKIKHQQKINQSKLSIESLKYQNSQLKELVKNQQKINVQLQQKIKKERQNYEQLKYKNKQSMLKLQNNENQIKKMKKHNEDLEDKISKLQNNQKTKGQLQRQIAQLQKKILQQIKNINYLKLQKENMEQENKILKKKINDNLKIVSQIDHKYVSSQRVIQQFKKKQQKLRRQIQDIQDQARKNKIQTKKAQDELHAIKALQAGWQVQKRKTLDQITNLQDLISKKQHDINRLNTEINRYKFKFEQLQQYRRGNNNELKKQIQSLQKQLIKKDRKIVEQTQENNNMRNRLQHIQKQNKKLLEHKNASFSDKLKFYEEQLNYFKKALNKLQQQNHDLKVMNNEMSEQLQNVQRQYNRLEGSYQQIIQREENLLLDLQAYIYQSNNLKKDLNKCNNTINQIQQKYHIKNQDLIIKIQYTKQLQQKISQLQNILYENKRSNKQFRQKINQLEIGASIINKLNQKIKLLQINKQQLQNQRNLIKKQYQNYAKMYTLTIEDHQLQLKTVKNNHQFNLNEEINKIYNLLTKQFQQKKKRLQEELMNFYTQNNKIQQQNQQKSSQISYLENQLQNISQIIKKYQKQINQNIKSIELSQIQLKNKKQKINNLQKIIQQNQNKQNIYNRQNKNNKNKIQQYQNKIEIILKQNQKLNKQYKLLQIQFNNYKQNLQIHHNNQKKYIQQLQVKIKQINIQFQIKNNNNQLQLQKMKKKQKQIVDQHVAKIKRIQNKMEQMQMAFVQKQKTLKQQYQSTVESYDFQIQKLSSQLIEKSAQLQQIPHLISQMQNKIKNLLKNNQNLVAQLQQTKFQKDEQIQKLKKQLKDSQLLYSSQIKQLKEQIHKNSIYSRQNNNQTNSYSRINTNSRMQTHEIQDKISKKYDQKLKLKDNKIEQLKQNIYELQQNLLKFKQKQKQFKQLINQLQKMKNIIKNNENQIKNIKIKYQQQNNNNKDLIRQLKKQILFHKQNGQNNKNILDQKILQYQNINCQLKIIKQLYNQLQKQLEKRKDLFSLHIVQQNQNQYQFKINQNKIYQLQSNLNQKQKNIEDLIRELQIKRIQISKFTQIIQQYKVNQDNMRNQLQKSKDQLRIANRKLGQAQNTIQICKTQLKSNKIQIIKLKKIQKDFKQSNTEYQKLNLQLKKQKQQFQHKYRSIQDNSQKYLYINQKCKEMFKCKIQQLLDKYMYLYNEKQSQINQLVEELEEMKFINDRKYLDYEEMKKYIIQLEIKVEDYDLINDQIDHLRKICDKLQQEKKATNFREQVLRMQVKNISNNCDKQLKSKLQSILYNQNIPSFRKINDY